MGVEPVVEPGDLVPRWPGGETAGESDSLPAPTGFLKKHNTIGYAIQYKRPFAKNGRSPPTVSEKSLGNVLLGITKPNTTYSCAEKYLKFFNRITMNGSKQIEITGDPETTTLLSSDS